MTCKSWTLSIQLKELTQLKVNLYFQFKESLPPCPIPIPTTASTHALGGTTSRGQMIIKKTLMGPQTPSIMVNNVIKREFVELNTMKFVACGIKYDVVSKHVGLNAIYLVACGINLADNTRK